MTPAQALLVAGAGLAAGFVNAIVGSGTLLSFPALLAVGLPPVVANATNAVGLVPGSVGGAYGYRRELAGQGRRAGVLVAASMVGAVCGAVLLLALPAAVFRAAVPVLLVASCALVLVQPVVRRRLQERRDAPAVATGTGSLDGHPASARAVPTPPERPGAAVGVGLSGVYGGYFGAGQSVVLIGLLGVLLPDDLQRLNGLKNVITAAVNGTAGVIFVVTGYVRWPEALLLAAGSLLGGWFGGSVGRRLPENVLRAAVVAVGLAVAGYLVVRA